MANHPGQHWQRLCASRRARLLQRPHRSAAKKCVVCGVLLDHVDQGQQRTRPIKADGVCYGLLHYFCDELRDTKHQAFQPTVRGDLRVRKRWLRFSGWASCAPPSDCCQLLPLKARDLHCMVELLRQNEVHRQELVLTRDDEDLHRAAQVGRVVWSYVAASFVA